MLEIAVPRQRKKHTKLAWMLPGPSALALDAATWAEVRDLSLNFWFVGPTLFDSFPVVHPGLEAGRRA